MPYHGDIRTAYGLVLTIESLAITSLLERPRQVGEIAWAKKKRGKCGVDIMQDVLAGRVSGLDSRLFS